jgi:hypothetical protein
MEAEVPSNDWRGRRADEISPLSLRVMGQGLNS